MQAAGTSYSHHSTNVPPNVPALTSSQKVARSSVEYTLGALVISGYACSFLTAYAYGINSSYIPLSSRLWEVYLDTACILIGGCVVANLAAKIFK